MAGQWGLPGVVVAGKGNDDNKQMRNVAVDGNLNEVGSEQIYSRRN